jgi:LysR family glycine cleavage system transcriptional activator
MGSSRDRVVAVERPSLTALRVFEVAARHQSFSKAADELCVTQAAISHQIRALEEWFGTRLFRRISGHVELISTGERYCDFLTELFDQLDAKTGEHKMLLEQSQLTIKVDRQFAAIWLVPRLVRFAETHPKIELDILTGSGDLDSRRDEARLAIQYKHPTAIKDNRSDLIVECLLAGTAYPVCRPDVLASHPIEHPRDLLDHTLLHGENRDWWQCWFAAAGVQTDHPLPGPLFSESQLAVLAAEAGQGIALLDDIESADALATGRLVRMMDLGIAAGEYVIMQNALMAETPVMATVKDWLRDEAAAFKDAVDQSRNGGPRRSIAR